MEIKKSAASLFFLSTNSVRACFVLGCSCACFFILLVCFVFCGCWVRFDHDSVWTCILTLFHLEILGFGKFNCLLFSSTPANIESSLQKKKKLCLINPLF